VKAFILRHSILQKRKKEGPGILITPYDIPASRFIKRLAKHLKENVDQITPPAWAMVAKTGSHVEKQPQDSDWWYTRCASVLRKIYVHGPIGAEELRADYGGRSGSVSKREHAVKAGGSIVRKALQQLEAAGFVENVKPRGRRVSREGRKLLQELAEEIGKSLVKEVPELEKYQSGEQHVG
jgi:small subunit ribosomal protein S19e